MNPQKLIDDTEALDKALNAPAESMEALLPLSVEQPPSEVMEELAAEEDNESLPEDELELVEAAEDTVEELDEPAVPELDQSQPSDRDVSEDAGRASVEELALEDVQQDREPSASADDLEEPEVVVSPDIEVVDAQAPEADTADVPVDDEPEVTQDPLDELPSTAAGEAFIAKAPWEPQFGLQGVEELPPIDERLVDMEQLSEDEPAVAQADRINREFQLQEQNNDEFAQELADKLDPYFEDIRADRENVVHEYFQRQQVITQFVKGV